MIDIRFYMKTFELTKRLLTGGAPAPDEVLDAFEAARSDDPVVYNIETTNACNMRCQMCPRTTMMTRPVATLDLETFRNIANQLRPWTDDEWTQWCVFVEREYGIPQNTMAENHFYLYVIPKVIQLHGYGAPLLDKHMAERLKILKSRGLYTYFSCNPANIKLETTERMLEAGLDYIKYSIESVDDNVHQEIRGRESNFSDAYRKICRVLDMKSRRNFDTTVVITMLDLDRQTQDEDFERLGAMFRDKDVYIYLKSEDQQWYRKVYHGTSSVHWSEVCRHPWNSMTIKSDGMAAMCMEDYNNEIILGDARNESLAEIWHGEHYRDFRRAHAQGRPGLKCTEQCDMPVVGELLARQ